MGYLGNNSKVIENCQTGQGSVEALLWWLAAYGSDFEHIGFNEMFIK